MKKFMRFLVASALLCGSLVAKDIAKDTLIVGTNAEYPPFEFVDENSKVTGFDMDLVAELAKRAGVKYEILNMSFDGLIPAIKSGKIDMIASGMSATPARKKAIDFTAPYYKVENLYVKRKDDSSLNSKADLQGKRLAAQLGTIQELAIRDIKGAEVSATENVFVAVMSLKNKKIDALCVDSSVGYEYLKKNDDLTAFFKESDGSEGFSIAFDKGKYPELLAKFNAALEEMKKDGSYEKLLEKYNLK